MDSHTALCFPETVPTFSGTAPLLLLLDGLTHYRPTESAQRPAHPLAESGLLHPYAPSPLGSKLDLFLRMVADLRGHAGEYYGGFLSTLSPGVASYQEESVRQLIAAMTKGVTPAPESREGDESFWQARLLLQLAENLFIEEMEVAEHLARLADQQQRMFQALKGDDDDDDEELSLAGLTAPPPRAPIRDSLLCRAWSRLFLADRNQERPPLLATTNHEAAELLHETYEKLTDGTAPLTLCRLPLPLLAEMDGQEFLSRRHEFREAATGTLTELTAAMTAAMATGAAPGQDELRACTERWAALLAEHFPDLDRSRRLVVTLYAGMKLERLCGGLAKAETPAESSATPPHGLLVHIQPVF